MTWNAENRDEIEPAPGRAEPGRAPLPAPGAAVPPQRPVAPPAWGPAPTHPTEQLTAPLPPLAGTGQGGDGGPGAFAAPEPGGTPPDGPRHDAARRGPGWGGVVAASLIAAVVASGASIGTARWLDDRSSGTASGAVTQQQSNSTRTAPQITNSTLSTPNWQSVAAHVSPSVVAIDVTTQSSEGQGSGVVLDTAGHVLTNNHVVSGGGNGTITVTLSDGRGYPAKIVGTDPETDLAVIKLDNPPSGLQPATLGESNGVTVGQPVMALGNPLGLSDTVTTGIVSAVNRPVTTQAESQSDSGSPSQGGSSDNPFGRLFGGGDQQPQQQTQSSTVVTNAIQTDAAINPGNSGGPLVNGEGQVIGITSSIASLGSSSGSSQSGSIGIGFAIPSDLAKNVAGQLIKDGKAQHAWLGVTLQDTTAKVDDTSRVGAGVVSVVSGAPADKAGLRKGDVITAVDGTNTAGAESVTGVVRATPVGTTIRLTVVRDGKAQEIPVTVQARSTN